MNNDKIDRSLAEVRQWREKLRITCESMSPQEETEYIHQKVQEIMQKHGLKLQKMDSKIHKSSREKLDDIEHFTADASPVKEHYHISD